MGFRRIRELGRGGVATVWLAVGDDGQEIALKQLDILRDDLRERLIHEGRFQRTVRHPNVVRVLDALDVDGRPTLVLELVTGGTLAAWAPGRDYAQIERALRGILAGLGAAHDAGLIHRDLKPSNILMDGDTPKIADFGLARALDAESGTTRTGMALGTPWYMPPEQIRDPRTVDRRADLWAVGALLYEMLSGRPPVVGDDVVAIHDQAVRRAWPPIRDLRPDVPANLAAAIDATLRPSREDRVADVTALLLVLDGAPAVDIPVETAGRWTIGKGIPAHLPVRAYEVAADGVVGVGKCVPIGAERTALARFEREEQLLRELAHPRIPRVLDGFIEGGRRWFVREAVPGQPLSAEMAARRAPLSEILDRLDQILRTVADLHALVPPVVHRDLTPDAIVIRPEGAWIVEFGTAKGDTDGRLADGTFVGTFGFMAPEQFGGEAGITSDVRAVGAIAAWMLTRRHPRALERNGELIWRPHTQVSPPLAAWVDNLIDPDPSRRPTAAAARAQLEVIRDDQAAKAPRPPPKPPEAVLPDPPRKVITAEPGQTVDLDFPEPPAVRPPPPAPTAAEVPRSYSRLGLGVAAASLAFIIPVSGFVISQYRPLLPPRPANVITIGAAPGMPAWPAAPDQIRYPPAPNVALAAPWDTIGLPSMKWSVEHQDEDDLQLVVTGEPRLVRDTFTAALSLRGWGLSDRIVKSVTGSYRTVNLLHRGDQTLRLTVVSHGAEQTSVVLQLVDVAPVVAPEPVGELSGRIRLDPPWDTLGLPGDHTEVVSQTASSITLVVPRYAREVGQRYVDTLVGRGWVEEQPLFIHDRVDDEPDFGGGWAKFGDAQLFDRTRRLVMVLGPNDPEWQSTVVTLSLSPR